MSSQAKKLQQLVDQTWRDDAAELVIVHEGTTYASEVIEHHPVDVGAIQDSVLAILMGIAQEKYLLETLDAINHHLEPEWTQVGPWNEAKLTIETLMTMTTGMDDQFNSLGEIGESWRYNCASGAKLKEILCLHTGENLQNLSEQWLFTPLQMQHSHWRAEPNTDKSSHLESTAVDLAKLGEALLNGGAPVLSDEFFLQQLAEPGSSENPAWGFSWWNNGQQTYQLPAIRGSFSGPIMPGAPSDTLVAATVTGSHLALSHELQLVVAKTGVAKAGGTTDETPFERLLWQEILDTIQVTPS